MAFDILPLDDPINWALDLEEKKGSDLLARVGLESKYFLNNMGSMLIAFLLYPLALLFHFLFKKLVPARFVRMHRLIKQLGGQLYWGIAITILFETFVIAFLCCMASLKDLTFNSYGEIVQSVSAIVFLVFLIAIPLSLSVKLMRHFYHLYRSDSHFLRKYKGFLVDMSLRKGPSVLTAPTFFFARRILLVLAVSYIKIVVFQFAVADATIIFSVISVGLIKPFETKFRHRMEIFSEISLMILLITFFCFTPFVGEVET